MARCGLRGRRMRLGAMEYRRGVRVEARDRQVAGAMIVCYQCQAMI